MSDKYQVDQHELREQLRIQVGFIERSADAYDRGYEDEARRLATVIRVLVHDTARSHSLLEQLGVKHRLRYDDTSAHPAAGAILVGSSGLAMQRVSAGPSGGGRYVPIGDDPSPDRRRPPVGFDDWWTRPYQIGSDYFSRKDIVLHVANKEGGVHVDTSLDQLYANLMRGNLAGWQYRVDGDLEADFEGNIALANLRQIARELRRTITEQLPHAFDADVILGAPLSPVGHGSGRNAPCPCGSGRKFKKCHGGPT